MGPGFLVRVKTQKGGQLTSRRCGCWSLRCHKPRDPVSQATWGLKHLAPARLGVNCPPSLLPTQTREHQPETPRRQSSARVPPTPDQRRRGPPQAKSAQTPPPQWFGAVWLPPEWPGQAAHRPCDQPASPPHPHHHRTGPWCCAAYSHTGACPWQPSARGGPQTPPGVWGGQ